MGKGLLAMLLFQKAFPEDLPLQNMPSVVCSLFFPSFLNSFTQAGSESTLTEYLTAKGEQSVSQMGHQW